MDKVYGGREQTRAKHDLLRRYLEPFAYKILQGFGSLDFVDCFAGPWKNRDLSSYSDTSFGIALEILHKVQEEIRKSGKRASVTCIFNEADEAAYEQLARFVQDASIRYPNIKILSLHGTFAENAARINSLAQNSFRLVYVDPTGWTGYPLEALRLAVPQKNSEVMINFMSSFIQRFLRDPEDRRNTWLAEMLGQRRAMQNAAKNADEAKIRELIAETLREDLKLDYVCQSPIAHRESKQIHFWMLYATRSPIGIDVLRKAEIRALTDHEKAREKAKSGNQGLLFELPPTGPYSDERFSHLQELERTILGKLEEFPDGVRFADLWPPLMTTKFVKRSEIGKAVSLLGKSGKVEETWKALKPRSSTPGDDDLIVLRRQA